MLRRASVGCCLAFLASCSSTPQATPEQPQLQTQPQTHVTCVGDSITAGLGTSSRDATYPAVLQRLLGPSFAVENDGHSGATMMKKAKPSYWSTDELARSTAWAASGGEVVIQLGTNDSWPHNWSHHETFLDDCKALVEHYRAAPGKPRVWVALIPPCCSGGGGDVIANEVVPLLRTCAKETGAPTIDVFGALRPYPRYFPDGVHPNDEGAALIAQTVHDAIVLGPTPTERITRAGTHIAVLGAFAAAISALANRSRKRRWSRSGSE